MKKFIRSTTTSNTPLIQSKNLLNKYIQDTNKDKGDRDINKSYVGNDHVIISSYEDDYCRRIKLSDVLPEISNQIKLGSSTPVDDALDNVESEDIFIHHASDADEYVETKISWLKADRINPRPYYDSLQDLEYDEDPFA